MQSKQLTDIANNAYTNAREARQFAVSLETEYMACAQKWHTLADLLGDVAEHCDTWSAAKPRMARTALVKPLSNRLPTDWVL